MARNNGRTVYLRTDGRWADKANDALKASGFYDSQGEACSAAILLLIAAGGGDLTIKGVNGEIERRLIGGVS